ncbi:DUF2817 domain-containing protein [Methylomonas rapida]|uniref:DUF2817 domain-containing protein n=1 Tax=Methylomonas rapida TaxID=2963939 RepID=A0ABY7GE02_9GAMM|nr:DUF2817 domain-containing protein [Methylomonas rapida]WAR43217.1 DUF2817 domain-containing protein [Methylomonas rapida]
MFSRFPFAEIDTQIFPASYQSARRQWLEQQTDLPYPCQHLRFACAGKGPAGEDLITDVLWLGEQQAENVVVLIAGTHGVEGLTGSAIQTDLLQLLARGQPTFPQRTALLLIHALTPWGFAWLRRCDADGVDLNRNAVDFSAPLPENLGYAALREALFAGDAETRQRLFDQFSAQHGRVALEIAISGGQYHDPAGPFFGGQAPAHGRRVCETLIEQYALSQRRLAVVDLHTGLGPYGYGEIICDHAPDSAGADVARQWYGDAVTLPLSGTSSSVPKTGLLDYLWHAAMDEHSCYVTLEFGTYSTDALFEVLLRDHQLWAQAENADERLAHSLKMRHHFCPNDTAWQEMVLVRARQVIAQAIRGASF